MSLSVKVYLNPDTENQEIRRFSVDEGASASFTYIQQKIESVFPSVRGKIIRLFWKDEDSELVTFSSGEELVEALGSIQGDVFRIYVKIHGEANESNAEPQDDGASGGVTHTNVVCDSCDVVISGTRFKCAVCPDYDLCAKCERKGNHNHHEMLRICFPRQHPWYGGAGGHPPCGPPPFAHPSGFGPWGRGGFNPWSGRGRGGPWGGRGRSRGHCGGPRERCGNGAKCQRHQEKDKKTTESTNPQQEVPVGPPFLHNMGEVLASLLTPMGVEVHTYADNEPVCCQGKCEHQEKKDEAATTSSPEGEVPPPQSPVNEGASTSGSAPMDTAPEQEDYVVVDKDKPKDEGATTADAATGTAADDVEVPLDPLEVAIAQMRAMGFEDDSGSGWLAQLIRSKQYDIGKVLDAIHFDGKQ